MIVQRGPRLFILYTRDGSRVLGRHPDYASAARQEAAIHAHQHYGNPSSVPLDLYQAPQLDEPYPFGSYEYGRASNETRHRITLAESQARERYHEQLTAYALDVGRDVDVIARLDPVAYADRPALARAFGKTTRDLLAAQFLAFLISHRAYLPQHAALQRGFGPHARTRAYRPAELRDVYERYAAAFERWFAALAALAARPEVVASQPLRLFARPSRETADALLAVQALAMRAQTSIAKRRAPDNELLELRAALGHYAVQLGWPTVGGILLDTHDTFTPAAVERGARAAERLAVHGDPGITRAASRAIEGRYAAQDRGEVLLPEAWVDRQNVRWSVVARGATERVGREYGTMTLVLQRPARSPSTGWAKPFYKLPFILDLTGSFTQATREELRHRFGDDIAHIVRVLYAAALQRAGVPLADRFYDHVRVGIVTEARAIDPDLGAP